MEEIKAACECDCETKTVDTIIEPEIKSPIKVKRKINKKRSATLQQMMVESASTFEYSEFNKDKIAESIEKEAGLNLKDAKEIANIVEKKLLDAKMQTPSTGLIRELINSILLDKGYMKELESYSNISMSVSTVDGLIKHHNFENSNTGFSPESINLMLAGQCIKQYAFKSILPKEVAESHLKGDIHFHDIDFINRIYCSGNSIEYVKKYGLSLPGVMAVSTPAKHPLTLVNHLTCFAQYLQGLFAGAIGWSNVNMFFAPLLEGLEYKEIKQCAQHLIYSFAQLAGNRGAQTVFSDLNMDLRIPSYFHKTPAIGKGGQYTGKTYKDYEKEARFFLEAIFEVLSEGDANGANFAFPKVLLHVDSNTDFKNDCLFKSSCILNAKRGSIYILFDRGKSVKISQCPVGGEETVLVMHKNYNIPIIRSISDLNEGEIYSVYADGKFVEGKFQRYDKQDLYKVSLTNKHSIVMSEKHLNLCICDKDKKQEETKSLSEIIDMINEGNDVWLPYSNNIYKGQGGNYELGYIVGAFAGDGNSSDGITTYCLSEGFKDNVKDKLIQYVSKHFGGNNSISKSCDSKGYLLRFSSTALTAYCREFILDKKRNKCYSSKIFSMSDEFRKGVFDGHLETDGRACQNRIYTSSIDMVKSITMLATSLGTVTSVNIDTREGRLGNEPVYCVLVFKNNMDCYKNIYFKHNYKTWIRINNIEFLRNDYAYCFEILNDSPVFTLANSGVLTHNCRLSISLSDDEVSRMMNHPEDLRFAAWQNITINLPRLAYKSKKEEDIFKEIDRLLDICGKGHLAKRNFINSLLDMGRMGPLSFLSYSPMSKDAYIRRDEAKFLVGMVGLNEMIQSITGKEMHESEESYKLGLKIIAHLKNSMDRMAKQYGINCILEETPAEGCSQRLALLDLKHFPKEAGKIVKGTAGESDFKYYTNSVHLSYSSNIDILSRITKQSKFCPMIQAGSMIHVWTGEKDPDPEALADLISYIFHNTNATQISFSPDFTTCQDCHTTGKGLTTTCPRCGSNNVYSMTRITGYFSKISGWTKGKLAELQDRQRQDVTKWALSVCEIEGKEKIVFFSKPNCQKCDIAKQRLSESGYDIETYNISTDDGLAMACYYNVDELPAMMRVNGESINSEWKHSESMIKWIKANQVK